MLTDGWWINVAPEGQPVLLESGNSRMYSSSAGWLDDISLFMLNLSIRGGSNDSVAGGAGSQP